MCARQKNTEELGSFSETIVTIEALKECLHCLLVNTDVQVVDKELVSTEGRKMPFL